MTRGSLTYQQNRRNAVILVLQLLQSILIFLGTSIVALVFFFGGGVEVYIELHYRLKSLSQSGTALCGFRGAADEGDGGVGGKL